jgi:hypothetical protein
MKTKVKLSGSFRSTTSLGIRTNAYEVKNYTKIFYEDDKKNK